MNGTVAERLKNFIEAEGALTNRDAVISLRFLHEIAAALQPDRPGSQTAVKALEWTGFDYIMKRIHAYPHDTGMPCYTVSSDGSGKWWRGVSPAGGLIYLADDQEAAQAAAQADYAQRIRSALVAGSHLAVTDEMVERRPARVQSAFEVLRNNPGTRPNILALFEYIEALEAALDQAPAADAGEVFQQRVQPWLMACFGPEISADRVERADRLLEEVFELLQSGGYDPNRVLALRDYVWGRDKGEPSQEVGGVMVTLAAYCLAHDLDMHQAGETELARIWTKVDKIRAKQAAKPTGSALPVATPTSPTGETAVREALSSIRQYGADTLSGNAEGPNDVEWYRTAVREMTKRARLALASLSQSSPAVEGKL